jgi:thiosulfate/3-mercaptopyruvate sulfurtransferase
MTWGPLVSADGLAAVLGDPDVRVIDLRWYLDDHTKGRREYEAGHIPGAAFVDLERDITGVHGAGRHSLPTREQLQAAMRRAGVNKGDRVVVYDDASASVAARLWWLLRIHGHPYVAVLDGGIQAWDRALERGIEEPARGDFVADEPDLAAVLSFEDIAAIGDRTALLDVRAPERFRGDVEPVDPIAGHVPGAVNAFWKDTLLAPDGTFLPADDLRERMLDAGAREGDTVVYCGSGVVASQTLLALELAGLGPVRIYAGGWSDWSSREGALIATGEEN